KRRNALFRAELGKLGLVGRDEIDPKIDIEPGLKFPALQLGDCLLEQLAIQIETDRHDMAALSGAENATRAANFQIAHGDPKSGAERAVLFDRVDPFARGANRHHLAREKQIRVSFMLGPADAPAELVKISQPKTIGAVDDDCVGVWNIQTALDDRGANEDVDLSGDETRHHFFKVVRIHLAVADLD